MRYQLRANQKKYEPDDIAKGEHDGAITCQNFVDPTTPFRDMPTAPIDRFVAAGKAGLWNMIEKGYANLHEGGSITFNNDLGTFWGDPMNSVRPYFSGPRVMLGETDGRTTLAPYYPGAGESIQKATITTGDTGAWNAIYGSVATIQVAQQQNAFAALPKRPYNRYGLRVVSAAAISSSTGIDEAAAVPTAVEPTYLEVNVGQKEIAVATDMSTRLELLSTRDDTITFGGNAQVVFSNFLTATDADLLGDADTVAGYNIESLDRYTSSYAKYGTYSDVGTATDSNWYNTVRAVAAASNDWDSNFFGATADRSLTLPLVDGMYAACYPYWGTDFGNKIWLTTPGTNVSWSFLEGAKQRYGPEPVAFSYTQGVQPVLGQAGGFKLNHYNTWPIVLDSQVKADTIGRIMLLDLNHTGMLVGRPIEAIQGNNPLYLQYFLNRLAFYGIMETYGDMPKSCAQLADLA